MPSTRQSKHPALRGQTFKTREEEFQALRGKPSARDYERRAQERHLQSQLQAVTIGTLRGIFFNLAEAAFDENRPDAVRADAQRQATRLATYLLPTHEETLCLLRKEVAQLCQDADAAHEYEARLSFDPYTDRLLDRLEQGNAEREAEWRREAEQRKKSQRRGRTRL